MRLIFRTVPFCSSPVGSEGQNQDDSLDTAEGALARTPVARTLLWNPEKARVGIWMSESERNAMVRMVESNTSSALCAGERTVDL